MLSRRIPRWLTPLATRAVRLNARLFHPLTMGVRAAVFDENGRVFLVEHSYVPGWHLPGGGVEPGETAHEALARELREEANMIIEGTAALHGVFFNRTWSSRDHVVVFIVRRYRVFEPREPDWEIVDSGFFDLDDLPSGIAAPSAARLLEIRDGAAPPQDW